MKKKVGIIRTLAQHPRKPARSHRLSENQHRPEREAGSRRRDDEQWQRDIATLRRAAQDLAQRRSEQRINPRVFADQFDRTAASVIECTDQQRPAIIRQLYSSDPERAASFLNMVLHGGTREERQQIGVALEKSGLVNEAIEDLTGSSHSHSYRAFSLLFLIAKAGTFGPLMRVIEDHPNIELRLALIRLLGTSGAPDLPLEFQRLLAKNSMPAELHVAIKETAMQLGGKPLDATPSAA
ncbi:MAG TPA: hypothetical protein VIG25_22250 [Pyrinomonadaceae bacterium]